MSDYKTGYNGQKTYLSPFLIFRKITQNTQTVASFEEGEEICWRWLIAETVARQRQISNYEWNKNTSHCQDESKYDIMINHIYAFTGTQNKYNR